GKTRKRLPLPPCCTKVVKINNNEELIALYEKRKVGEETSSGMVSVRLTAELQRVKDVLKTWKEVDVRVSKLCPSQSHAGDRPTVTPCSSNFNITDGLVGFFSDNFFGKTWKDEYLGVNATVRDGTAAATVAAVAAAATKASEGVTFRGAWAEWPVGKQGENQLYHFANYNFTLVATVSIDGEPKGDTPIPLMGVKLNDDEKTVLLGLSYKKKKVGIAVQWREPEGVQPHLGATDTVPSGHCATERHPRLRVCRW
ncbi:trans-sialidase, putative, partial [Trypanosoma cruzi marinkellei]